MKERDFQNIFGKINTQWGVFELKLARGKSLRFDSLQPHQADALMNIGGRKGFYHKLSDPPVFSQMNTRFNSKRPFDCFHLKSIPAFVVIIFYTPRKRKTFYYIRISDFLAEQKRSERKSITEERCKRIAWTKREI
jgi:hypothetical protein